MSEKNKLKERKQYYNSCISSFEKMQKSAAGYDLFLTILRLFIFFGGIALFILVFISFSYIYLISALILIPVFTAVAIIHDKVGRAIKKRNDLIKIYKSEISCLEDLFTSYDDGSIYKDNDHKYSSDLDIYGEFSLFHYINRTASPAGKNELNRILSNKPVDKENIFERQTAVKELCEKPDFRNSLLLEFYNSEVEKNCNLNELSEMNIGFIKSKFLQSAIFIIPVITFLLFFVALFFNIWFPFILLLTFQLIINGIYQKRVLKIFRQLNKKYKATALYRNLIRKILNADFKSDFLINLKEIVSKNPDSAFKKLSKLSFYLSMLDLRNNHLLHFPLNSLFFYDMHILLKTSRWLDFNKNKIPEWLKAIGSIEAFSSIATLAFNNPDYAWPVVESGEFFLHAESISHPLIVREKRVKNTLNVQNSAVIITGPNMSGKSTFLRTTGVNMILAWSGSPVCAEGFSFSLVDIYTSMQVHDSLKNNISFFYAELSRIKKLLDAIKNDEKIVLLIDEMLKGTNYEDRHKGSAALLKQFAEHKIPVFIGTHDTKLAQMEKDYPDSIVNYHFDSYIKDEKLFFDYKLAQGVCRSTNSTILMKKTGISIDI